MYKASWDRKVSWDRKHVNIVSLLDGVRLRAAVQVIGAKVEVLAAYLQKQSIKEHRSKESKYL